MNTCSCCNCVDPDCWTQYDNYEIIGYLCPQHVFTHKICIVGKECLPMNEFDNDGRSSICRYHNTPMSTDLLKNNLKEDLVTLEKFTALINLLKSLNVIPEGTII